MTSLPKLFKIDSNGRPRAWWIELDDAGSWRSHSGLVDGKTIVGAWKFEEPKSKPTAIEQARFVAQSEYDRKIEMGGLAESLDESGKTYFQPMLAKKYSPSVWKTHDFLWSQPKLDGIRCVASSDGLFTRNGKPINGVPHVFEALKSTFEEFPALVLDGELYNHELRDDFNTISSVVRKVNPTPEQIKASAALIQYWVYDIPSSPTDFTNRATSMSLILPEDDAIAITPSVRVGTVEDLNDAYAEYLSDGYEGQMVRVDAPYESKRSKNLLKRKEFRDEEFEIISIEEGKGNWLGCGKTVRCRLPDGREFGAGVKGTRAFTRDLLERRDEFPGTLVTVQFFDYTPDGVPRFPIGIKFHGKEGKS